MFESFKKTEIYEVQKKLKEVQEKRALMTQYQKLKNNPKALADWEKQLLPEQKAILENIKKLKV